MYPIWCLIFSKKNIFNEHLNWFGNTSIKNQIKRLELEEQCYLNRIDKTQRERKRKNDYHRDLFTIYNGKNLKRSSIKPILTGSG